MTKNILITILIIFFTIIYSCNNNYFEKNSLKAGEILKNAYNLEEFTKTEDIVKNNETIVRIYSKKDRSNKYLKKNKTKLFSIYKKIRPFADKKSSKFYYEALFICTTINQSLYMLLDEPFEDTTEMINKIKEIGSINSINLADWVVNDFYGKLEVPENLLQHWILMKKQKKTKKIYDEIILKYGNELILKGKFKDAEEYYNQLSLLSGDSLKYKKYAIEIINEKRKQLGNSDL